MAGRTESTAIDLYKIIVPALLTALGVIIWFYLSGLKTEVSEIQKDVVASRIEMTKAVGAVEKQVAITNSKLEQFLQDIRPRR